MVIQIGKIEGEVYIAKIGVQLGKYLVQWWASDQCTVFDEDTAKIENMPWLPFDITLDQLNIYLSFL